MPASDVEPCDDRGQGFLLGGVVKIWKVLLASGILGTLVAAPVTKADPSVGVAPAWEIQLGCAAWADVEVTACYLASVGALAGVAVRDGEIRPTYFVGNADQSVASEGDWEFLVYNTPETGAVWESIEMGELFAPPGGELASVNGDVSGCSVQFELRRTLESEDSASGTGPSVGLWGPGVNLSASTRKTTTTDGSGTICGVGRGPVSLGFIVDIVIAGAGGGENDDRLREAMEMISDETGVPLPTLPERLPPPQP
jgi:hypothetical protein